MWTRALLKQNAKVAFQRNYWTCVAVTAIAMLLSGGISIGSTNYTTEFNVNNTDAGYSAESLYSLLEQIPPYFWVVFLMALIVGTIVGLVLAILVSNVVLVGRNRYFLENREHKTSIGQLFYGFQGGRYGTTVWIMFLRLLYIWGWTLLFIIPGIIKSYSYMLVPYILAENTYLDRKRVFELSSQMMKGHKWEAFVLELSFLGWFWLGALTGGIVNIFYANPYMSATYAEFYTAIKAEAKMKGIIREGELPDFLIPEV